MYLNEYGNPTDPVVVLLAPMMVSGQNLYDLMHPYLTGKYCIIAPDQGGHGKAGAYVSAEEEYAQLKACLLERGYRKIRLSYGASLGVALAYRLYRDPDFCVEYGFFDGVALTKKAPLVEHMMSRMFRGRKQKLEKHPVEASPSLVKFYGTEFAKMMTANFRRITPGDIDAICAACCHYDLAPMSREQQQHLHIEYGSSDPDLRLSKKALKTIFPDAEVKIRKGYTHCSYMAHQPQAYVREIEAWIGTSPKTDRS